MNKRSIVDAYGRSVNVEFAEFRARLIALMNEEEPESPHEKVIAQAIEQARLNADAIRSPLEALQTILFLWSGLRSWLQDGMTSEGKRVFNRVDGDLTNLTVNLLFSAWQGLEEAEHGPDGVSSSEEEKRIRSIEPGSAN